MAAIRTSGWRCSVRVLACGLTVSGVGCSSEHDSGVEMDETSTAEVIGAMPNGELSSLIPFHKDAIHASVMWDGDRDPWLCMWMRPSEYRGSDLVDANTGPLGTLRDVFQQLVYGGFGFSGNLDASVRTRIKDDIARENVQCIDLNDPLALWESGKQNVADLTETDFATNAHAFLDAGHSLGLNYNLFCSGHTQLADGRLAVFGGHDKSGNYGIDAVNILDLKKWEWSERVVPAVKEAFLADPTNSVPASHPSALDEQYTDPYDPSDLKYQRWYPTVVALPDGKVLVLSGTDQDSSKPQNEAAATKVRMGVPEIWDPECERTIPLENAYKLLAMYARSYVVQTGPHANDWKVAVTGHVSEIPPNLSAYDPFTYSGETHFLDVRAALEDPYRDVPGTNHWSYVATATIAHSDGAGAQLWELDHRGMAKHQRVVAFGGDGGAGTDEVSTVEMIDYSAPTPTWQVQQPLAQPVNQNLAVALPDGTALVLGGRGSAPGTPATNNLAIQLFNPNDGTVKTVATTPVPRHDHATALLLPDASVAIMGGNRVQLVPGQPDAGVPVAEIYRPAYLFKGPRPKIKDAPKKIEYGKKFWVEVGKHTKVSKVALVRTGPVTHNWDWGNRYVGLTVEQHGNDIRVTPPKYPGLAVPGDYMLFVIDDKGVPSVAKVVRLKL